MDDISACELVCKLDDPTFVDFLLGIGRQILGIFGEVGITSDRLLHSLTEAGPLLSTLLELVFEGGVPSGGHREKIHVCASIVLGASVLRAGVRLPRNCDTGT